MPVKSREGVVLGTFGTCFRECRLPSDDERAMVAHLAALAAEAIEFQRGLDS